MRVGIIGGTGPAGSGLGLRLGVGGHDIVLGSRSHDRAQDVVRDLVAPWTGYKCSITGGNNAEAAACELIVIATPWDSAATTASEHSEALRGKIVITMANALVRVGKEFQPLVPPRGSIAVAAAD